ncbi:FHF complex subunit HOOK-interacting protein 1B isoform X1 [Ahaetulla prasina]|uniref:FHF complex subunit HOOK-interacting protein 1B isoform X1 n=2 Tax=Ahaetulla prasina TaxID=499056 RepID=UPI00264A1DCA|nr:FHF complex subunit HOOK-interacting protein 1B isoform X1 [Ahaetulla prasina]XP_058042085.1 FHF complex subunit HOOK-interacting protein 1B isoform X1 [Ahaetulla prasina]XP_058042086.1 FHF complex subunit HOOK-interacting protein 1B isoform X1 [Ahaetulla prasina]XP_058042087.1 FHF complex subunit HOOK-interacting protein 1B isoform X1 [Ahaetulla prasina]
MEKMSWLSKLNPRAAAGPRASRGASLQGPVMADPETCLMVFKNHWAQVLRILEKRGPHVAPGAADDLSAVRNNTYQMVTLLAEERPRAEPAMGPILEFAVSENVLEHLLGWHLQWEVPEERKVELLKLFEMLISQAHQPLLHQKGVVAPLLRLLALCAEPASPLLETNLVLLLNQLCVSVARDPPLLELFFHSPSEQGPPHLLLFSLLIPYIHHEGVVGQQARDALLLLMAVSSGSRTVARYITEHSYFCPVLATGLSALYSSLPRKLEVRGDDWHFLRREDWIGVPSLVLFMNSLEFCNAVIQVAHPLVQKQLVDYIHNGFLVPVMGPALHKTSIEEMIASTAYLDLFLRSISETALLKTFLCFLLLHHHDSSTILDTLVARIASNSRLCMVSLSLFRTLIGLHCEDVLLQLVLRYLIPCSHVMLSQKRAVKELDLYGKAAAKFLSLIPRCCCPESLPIPEQEEERAAWSKGQGSPSVDSSSVVTVPRPSTPSRISFFTRQSSFSMEAPSATPHSPGTPVGSPGHRPGRWEEVSELEGNYLEYLRDARLNIDLCVRACRVWSAPYDGEEPNAVSLALPPGASSAANACVHPRGPLPDPAPASPRTKKRGASLEGAPDGLPPSNAPPADTKDKLSLLNGAHMDAGIKKGRWCPPEGPLKNGSVPSPNLWEGASCLDLLAEEGLSQAPLENGGPLTVEEFHRELCQLQDEMANGGRTEEDPGLDSPSGPEPLSREEEEAYHRFSSCPEGLAPVLSADPLSQIIISPPRALGQPPSQPFTGPFLAILLAKLENMLQNSLYVNFLLTGLLAQLACYPQPLLRSFLLNTNMVFQPSVKSLLQVLGSVKNKIEGFAASQEDFPSLLFKARKYLIARARPDTPDATNPPPPLRRPEALVKSRKPTIGELIMRHTNSPTRARQAAQLALQHVREGQVLQALSGSSLFRGSAEKQSEALRVKNAVYCAVIFSEFLKELAAIAQAHAVTSPFLLEPPTE